MERKTFRNLMHMYINDTFKLNGESFSSNQELLIYSKEVDTKLYDFLNSWFDQNDYVIVNTSGSTGKPKPIKLKKEFMINSALATGKYFNLLENTTALLCLSTDYIAGKMMLIRALTLGWHIDMVSPKGNPLKNIKKSYDFSAMVPMQLQQSLANIHLIKKLIVGGGVVSTNLQKDIQQISTEVFATYGMTETITHIAVKQLNHLQNNQISCYHTLPNIKLSKDNRGCLVINAPKVSKELVVTNDVIHLQSATSFEWLGRYDNVINSGGIKLHPEKIEEKLSEIIKQRFFVASKPNNLLGEQLILVIEGNSYVIDFSEVPNLDRFEIPKQVFFVPEFIQTETQKIQRNKTLALLK